MRFADLLMNVAYRYVTDVRKAEDIVHDSFYKIFKNINQFKETGSSFEAWIKRITINEALMRFRREKIYYEIDEKQWNELQNVDISILDELQAEDILKLIAQLPKGCAIVFNLYVIEGFKHNEIGDLLNIKASASRAQLARAKSKLRELLNKQNYKIYHG